MNHEFTDVLAKLSSDEDGGVERAEWVLLLSD